MISGNLKDDKLPHQSDDSVVEHETDTSEANKVSKDDHHKVEKLTKAGRDFDPDEGTE